MRRTALAPFAWIALLLASVQAAGEPLDAAKQRDIEEILRVLEWDPGPDVLPMVVRALRRSYPDVPESDWDDVQRAGEKLATPTERMISLYHRQYTAEELRQLLAFYRSPLGQKVLRNSGEAVAERMVGKNEYAVQVSNLMESILRDRGYERAPVVPLAAPAPEVLTPQSEGRVFRPKIVQPGR